MGLINARNIAKVKALADKNKDKIADGVVKATTVIDEKTGGKHRDKLAKIDHAAQKYAGIAVPTTDDVDPVKGDGDDAPTAVDDPPTTKPEGTAT